MANNPYSEMIEVFKGKNNEVRNNVMIGKVITSNPILIQIGDLQIDRDNILIADYLKTNHRRKISVKGERIKFNEHNPTGFTSISADHSHSIKDIGVDNTPVEINAKDDGSYIQTEDTLNIGDRLAILQTGDKQLYIIIARLEEI